jgi:hypothetical protein
MYFLGPFLVAWKLALFSKSLTTIKEYSQTKIYGGTRGRF